MEAPLLERLGKVAGLGGISIGVVFLIFKDVLGQKFLPETGLAQQQAFAVVIALSVMTFGIAAVGILGWLVSKGAASRPIPTSSLCLLAFLVVAVLGAAVYIGNPGQQSSISLSQPFTASGTLSPTQFTTESQAQNHCPADIVVWVNIPTGVYHFREQSWYGKTKSGAYICRKEADKYGYRPSSNGQ